MAGAALILSLSLAVPVPALAQAGSLQGRVRDGQGGTVEGAGVVARVSVGGEILASTATDALVYFRFDGLRAGPVFAEVRRLGFADRTVEAVVREDEIATVTIELAVQAWMWRGSRRMPRALVPKRHLSRRQASRYVQSRLRGFGCFRVSSSRIPFAQPRRSRVS